MINWTLGLVKSLNEYKDTRDWLNEILIGQMITGFDLLDDPNELNNHNARLVYGHEFDMITRFNV